MSIGWIDFSKDERNKVLNVIHLLDEPGAVGTCPCYDRILSSETLTLNCLDWSQEKLAL